MDVETNNKLPFLDLLIKKSDTGLVFSVFRKPTHTDRYLNRRSCHPDSTFKGLVTCMKRRAVSVCSGSEVQRELGVLKETFNKNGYSVADMRPLTTTTLSKKTKPNEPEKRIVLPFYPSTFSR